MIFFIVVKKREAVHFKRNNTRCTVDQAVNEALLGQSWAVENEKELR